MEFKCPHCGKNINPEKDIFNHELEDLKSKAKLEVEKEFLKRIEENERQNRKTLEIEKTLIAKQAVAQKELELIEERSRVKQIEMDAKEELQKQLIHNQRLLKDIEELRNKSTRNDSSMELKGEIQEEIILNELKSMYPTDSINEVKKGQMGADVVLEVIYGNKNVGSIIIESKNTKDFSSSWINKLKEDQKAQGAHFAILVTKAVPKEMKDAKMNFMAETQTLYICTLESWKVIVDTFRKLIIMESTNKHALANYDDIKDRLYKRVTDPKFIQSLRLLNDYFTQIQDNLGTFKKQMNKFLESQNMLIGNIQDSILKVETTIESTTLLENKKLD